MTLGLVNWVLSKEICRLDAIEVFESLGFGLGLECAVCGDSAGEKMDAFGSIESGRRTYGRKHRRQRLRSFEAVP